MAVAEFLPLFGRRSTFQDTLLRVSDAALFERPVVIEADVLLEPVRRDSGRRSRPGLPLLRRATLMPWC
jgi:mannose-1-phosphate guanylyltransferase/mannose-6-phosphate isomerase